MNKHNRKLDVLVFGEFSGIVSEQFKLLGHNAWSIDLLPSEKNGNHIQGNGFDFLECGWDLMIAHPPCTYLANSGVCWLGTGKGKTLNQERWQAMIEGAEFFKALLNAPIPMIAIENPIMHKYGREIIETRYSQVIQPYEFGEAVTKKTCLWLKGLPPLLSTMVVTGKMFQAGRDEPNNSERQKNRSRTYPGIAAAMAMQWGGLVS